jgi:hypothetical protein
MEWVCIVCQVKAAGRAAITVVDTSFSQQITLTDKVICEQCFKNGLQWACEQAHREKTMRGFYNAAGPGIGR